MDEYRDVYKVNREFEALRGLLRDIPIYAVWDDHEVEDDYDGQTVDSTRYAIGRKAFFEYMPIRKRRHLHDPSCAGNPLFRVFRWGKDVDLIRLDERSCRSADVEAACRFNPSNPAIFDPAPTLPPLLRRTFLLPESPPLGCLEAIFAPSRTLLGRRQKAALKTTLLHSQAKFKLVLNEVPIQQFYASPYDRWEGYGAERNEILSFIRDNDIEGVIFLTGDTHANLINEIFIDRLTPDAVPIGVEFVTGPVASSTLEQDIVGQAGQPGLDLFNTLLDIAGVECRHLNTLSYGLAEVDTSVGTTTVTLKDDTGAVLSDQQNPSIACTKTLGL